MTSKKSSLRNNALPSEFMGHPLIDAYRDHEKQIISERADGACFRVALLPGSRESEITRLLPVMLETARKVRDGYSGSIEFILAKSSNVNDELYSSVLGPYPDLPISILIDNTPEALISADFAIVASGTATLEAAVTETPFIIIYKTSPLTFFLGRLFANVSTLGLANFVAGKEVAPEFLQEDGYRGKYRVKDPGDDRKRGNT